MIDLDGIVKDYGRWRLPRRRAVRALEDVSLKVPPGSALGVIGLNGAGKSTLLRILLGYVRPTSGRATIAGQSPRQYAESSGIAYVPERVAIPGGWTVRGALQAYALLGNGGADTSARIESALALLGLEDLSDRTVRSLSKGNLQRLTIAQLLLDDRKLMVLDEPTDGLDPLWIARLRNILVEWRNGDPERVLIVASHNLHEVERIVDRAVVLHDGRLREQFDLRAGAGGEPLETRFLKLVESWTAGA